MSVPTLNLLRVLVLCALAHTICSLSVPVQLNITESFETATDPPAIAAARSMSVQNYVLVVRGQPEVGARMESQLINNMAVLEPQCNAPAHKAVFSGYDYTVLLTMLVISLGIGAFYGFFKKSGNSSSEFLLGSEMTVLPVTLSLATSFITAIELLGNPAEMYYQGTQFVLIVVPMVAVIPVAVKIFYPIYFRMQLTSCYEYLGIRFGKEIRVLAAILYIVQMCFYTAVAVLAPAIALSKATGLNTKLAVVLIYLVCIFYSSQGGMKAVVIADTFQAAVLAFSLILIVVLGCFYSGGISEIFQTAAERNRLEFLNFDINPTTRHTVYSVIIGGFFYWTSLFCTNQASVQKCMSLKSPKLARLALIFSILGLVLVFLLNFYTGLMVYNHYSECDPLLAGRITAADQLLPYYIMSTYERLHTVAGIFVAGIFAASLGTVASALNSLSAVTCEDLLSDGLNIKLTAEKGALYAKWMSMGFGVLSFGLVFIVEHLGGVLQATLTLNGLIGGVTLGLFVLGMVFKSANTKGAFIGGLIALAIVIFVGVVAQLVNVAPTPLPLSVENCGCAVNTTQNVVTEAVTVIASGFTGWPIFRLSYMWYSMIGTLLTIFLGLIISNVINFIQRSQVLRINSAKANGVIETGWKPEQLATHSLSDIKTTTNTIYLSHSLGHVNHGVHLDDE